MTSLRLTDVEAKLLVELLESKERNLLAELRRTEGHLMHEELTDLLRTVERLTERLREMIQPVTKVHTTDT